jgi:hypothetical protein
VLVYDNSLDNQQKATWNFARQWFGPYVVTSVNDNGTYHLAELDGKRIAVPVAEKKIVENQAQHRQKETAESAVGQIGVNRLRPVRPNG